MKNKTELTKQITDILMVAAESGAIKTVRRVKHVPDSVHSYDQGCFEENIEIDFNIFADALVRSGLKFDTIISHTATFNWQQSLQNNQLAKQLAETQQKAEKLKLEKSYLLEAFKQYISDIQPRCSFPCPQEIKCGSPQCQDFLFTVYCNKAIEKIERNQ